MNKKTVIQVSMVVLLVGAMFAMFFFFNSKKEDSDAVRFANDYPSVSKDNIFTYRTGEEIVKILEHGSGVVFLGFKECGWCQAYAPILNETAINEGMEKIFYFDIKEDRANNTSVYQKIVSLLKDYLDFDDEGNERIFVPDVTFVNNGEIVGHNNDTSSATVETDGEPTLYWNDLKKNELVNELISYMDQIDGESCGSECNN